MSLFFCLLPFVQRCLCLLFQLSNFCSERKPSCRRFLHNSFSCRNLNFLLSSQNLETYLGATERVRDLWDLWYRVTICHVSLIHTYPYTHIISNCSLEELQELHSIDRSVVRLNAKWEVFLSFFAFTISSYSLASLSSLPPHKACHYQPLRFSKAFHCYSHIIHVCVYKLEGAV